MIRPTLAALVVASGLAGLGTAAQAAPMPGPAGVSPTGSTLQVASRMERRMMRHRMMRHRMVRHRMMRHRMMRRRMMRRSMMHRM